MDIGIGLPNPVKGVEGRALVAWASRAEERGFSSLATIDRIAYPSYESLVTLAAAAGVTERIELLTNVLLGPTRNPVILAKEAASVDQLSGGRLTLGLSVGGRPDDFEAVGESFEARGRRWDESLELMSRVWKGEPVPGSPEPIGPRPVRDGGIPVLIGGMSDQAIARTIRFGVGWTAGGAPPEQVGPFAERVRAAWAESGREGTPRIVALSYFSLGDDAEEASREYLKDYYAFLGEWADAIAEGALRTRDAIRERIKQFEDMGMDLLILDPTVGVVSQVDRLADEVL
jgi:probable F420-dependent oxidoreductase